MNRKVDYTWRLAEIMAAHGMHNSTDLIPRLAERGIQLSRPQVYRIVHQRPERTVAAVTGSTVRHPRLRSRGPPHRHGNRRAAQESRNARRSLPRQTSSISTNPCGRAARECSVMTINPNRRSRPRGRPHVNNGALRCTRCAGCPPNSAPRPGQASSSATAASTPRCAPTGSARSADTTACCPAAPTAPILGRSAWPAPASPRTTNAEPATPKARSTGTGDALAAPCART